MHFKLVYENHWNFGLSVSDTLLMLKYALEEAGHRADIVRDFTPGAVNIVLEHFTDEFVKKIDTCWDKNTHLIIIATEFITGESFNDPYYDPDSGIPQKYLYGEQRVWKNRFDNFVFVAKRAKAVWHLATEPLGSFRKTLDGITRVGYLPHLYSTRFSRVVHRPDHEKDLDVVFSGARTVYRENLVNDLKKAGLKIVFTHQMTAPFHREDLLSRAKLAINVKQYPDWKHESNSRLYYHVANDSLVITDQCEYTSDLNPYARTRGENWLHDIQEELSVGHFTERAIGHRERFAKERPTSELMTTLLEESGL